MPYFVVQKLLRLLTATGERVPGMRVLVLGVAFKRNVADARNSPALKLLELLQEHGIDAAYHDPHIARVELRTGPLDSVPLTAAALGAATASSSTRTTPPSTATGSSSTPGWCSTPGTRHAG